MYIQMHFRAKTNLDHGSKLFNTKAQTRLQFSFQSVLKVEKSAKNGG